MAIKLKLELKWTKIKRVVTLPRGLNLYDLHDIIQAMFGFEHGHLWNFRDKAGNEWNTDRNPFGGLLSMDMRDMLDPEEFCIEDVLVDSKKTLLYSYDYGDGWEIVVTRMADSKGDEIACVETVGTDVIEDVGGVGGLEEFTELLRNCKIKSEDEITKDTDWRIAEWGYCDPAERAAFLNGPTLEELTEILRDEVEASIAAREDRVAEAEYEAVRENPFKDVGRNDPCPCGSGKKFKKCCGASAAATERAVEKPQDPNWAPEGVTVTKDDTKGAWICPHPKWIMRLVIEKDGTAEGDAERVLNGVFRPYFERFCTRVLKEEEVVILQNSQMHDEKTFSTCPSVVIVHPSEIMDIYKKKLIEFFKYFCDTEYFDCEVRYDQSCGGPILTLTNAEGDIEIYFIGMPDRYHGHT